MDAKHSTVGVRGSLGRVHEQMHARSSESIFVSRPSTPEVAIPVDHYHMEPL